MIEHFILVSMFIFVTRKDLISELLFVFILEFRIIICGLDSVVARRWINSMLVRHLKENNSEQNYTTDEFHLKIH